jgi:hypothetical protein
MDSIPFRKKNHTAQNKASINQQSLLIDGSLQKTNLFII